MHKKTFIIKHCNEIKLKTLRANKWHNLQERKFEKDFKIVVAFLNFQFLYFPILNYMFIFFKCFSINISSLCHKQLKQTLSSCTSLSLKSFPYFFYILNNYFPTISASKSSKNCLPFLKLIRQCNFGLFFFFFSAAQKEFIYSSNENTNRFCCFWFTSLARCL